MSAALAANDGPPPGQFPEDGGQMQVNPGADAPPKSGGRNDKPNFDVGAEIKAFYAKLEEPGFLSELKSVLPDTISVDSFVRTAKTAVQADPILLNPPWRPSLMRAIAKAAQQGMPPDGKHAVLIARWDEKANVKQVCYQPMVWGVIQAGRRAGAVKRVRPHIIFEGEKYKLLGGFEDRIDHEIDPSIVEEAYRKGTTPEAFFERIVLAYCIIEAPDGTLTWRYMTRSRIMRVRASSKAGKGPWNGQFLDEMILKTVMLFTCKHIDLSGDSLDMQRFRAALEQDLDVDFDEDERPVAQVTSTLPPGTAAAITYSPKLDTLADKLARGEAPVKEPVGAAAGEGGPSADLPGQMHRATHPTNGGPAPGQESEKGGASEGAPAGAQGGSPEQVKDKQQAQKPLPFEGRLRDETGRPTEPTTISDAVAFVQAYLGLYEQSQDRDRLLSANWDALEAAEKADPRAAQMLAGYLRVKPLAQPREGAGATQQKQAGEGAGGGSAATESPADKAAREFADRLANDLAAVGSAGGGKAVAILRDRRVQERLGRLRGNQKYRVAHYDRIVKWCAGPPIIEAIGDLQTEMPIFYDDVMAESITGQGR